MNDQYVIMQDEQDTGTGRELYLDQILWEPDCGVRAGGSIRHDGDNLLVHLWAKEKDIRAEYTAPLSPVHEDSCLEFFFMPEGEERYLNFEINPNGCLHIGFGRDRNDRERIVPDNPEKLFSIRTSRTAGARSSSSFLRSFSVFILSSSVFILSSSVLPEDGSSFIRAVIFSEKSSKE